MKSFEDMLKELGKINNNQNDNVDQNPINSLNGLFLAAENNMENARQQTLNIFDEVEKQLKDNKEKYREEESNILLFSKPKNYTLVVQMLGPDGFLSLGHARVGMSCGYNLKWFGFNPSGVKEEVDDLGRKNVSKNITIISEQYERAFEFIKSYSETYSATTNNCIMFVDRVLEICKIPERCKDLFSFEEMREIGVSEWFVSYCKYIEPLSQEKHNIENLTRNLKNAFNF